MSGYISTHVLNMVSGRPGGGIHLRLLRLDDEAGNAASKGPRWLEVARSVTDGDGRVFALAGDGSTVPLLAGRYRIEFDLDGYFAADGLKSFLPEAVIGFIVADTNEHYHVPLLLSPNGFSTYRGS